MSVPHIDDVLLRACPSGPGFELVHPTTFGRLAGPVATIFAAVEAARSLGANAIWQQSFDNRGRPLGDPFRLLRPTDE